MKDFISKDPSFAEISKQVERLKKDLRSAEKKATDRVTKLLADRLKIAISAHKWKILNREEYSQYSHSPEEVYYELSLSTVSEQSERPPTYSAASNGSTPSKALKASNLRRRKAIRFSPKEIKNYNDLIHFGESWDISQIKKGKCLIIFSFDYLRIVSYVGMEEVFQTIKDLEITLDLSHHIQDLEKSERELDFKRALTKDLSAKILFAV